MVVIINKGGKTLYIHADRITYEDGKAYVYYSNRLIASPQTTEVEAVLS